MSAYRSTEEILTIKRSSRISDWTEPTEVFVTATGEFDMTDLVVSIPGLVESIRRAKSQLRSGNLLTDRDVFGTT